MLSFPKLEFDVGFLRCLFHVSCKVDNTFRSTLADEEHEKKQADTKPQAEDDLNAQLNPDSEDDSELEEDRLTKGGLLLKDMLKQDDESSDDEDDEEIDEDQTKSAVLLQGSSLKICT